MDFVIERKKDTISVFVDNKKIKITGDYCYFSGNIYNIDEIDNSHQKIEKKILKLYIDHGVDIFNKINGEYFIAMVINKKIILIRDKIGSKQIYYSIIDGNFVASTSLKYFICNYKDSLKIDNQSLANYLCYFYINEPRTIFKNVYKLCTGSSLVYNNKIRIKKYFNLVKYYLKHKNKINDLELAEEQLEKELKKSLSKRIGNKENIGVFLSAGVDSTLITSLLKEITDKNINAYTIGFHEIERDESNNAKLIAEYLKVNHFIYNLDQDKAIQAINKIPKIYSEPFADPSIIPTVFLNENVDKNQEVILTGDGADQLFSGSNVYDSLIKNERLSLKSILKYLIREKSYEYIFMPKKYVTKLYFDVKPERYFTLFNKILKPQSLYMLFDLTIFLPNRLLTKMNFAKSYHKLNVVHPFVDDGVLFTGLKINNKYNRVEKKYILKKMLFKRVPSHLLNNGKNGFGIPLKKWLYGFLKFEIMKYSTPEIIEKQGIFSLSKISDQIKKLNEETLDHKECSVMFSYYMFQLWYCEYIDNLLEKD